MTNRYEDVNYRLARRGNVRARAQREAWDAVSFLVDIVAGRVPIRDEGDEGDEGDDDDGRANWAGRRAIASETERSSSSW